MLLGNFTRSLDAVLCAFCATIVAAFALLLTAQVVLRLLDVPLFWVEELCQYLLIYLCFLGSAVAWGRREHLTVEFLPELLTGIWRSLLLAFVDLVVLAFSIWAAFVGFQFSIFSMRKMSVALDVPVGYGYLGVPVAFIIIAVQSAIFVARLAADPYRSGGDRGPHDGVEF